MQMETQTINQILTILKLQNLLLLTICSYHDIKKREIPNIFPILLMFNGVIFVSLTSPLQFLYPIITFSLLFPLFILGFIGGGDIKLITTISLTLTFTENLKLLFLIAFIPLTSKAIGKILSIILKTKEPKLLSTQTQTINSKLLTEGDILATPIHIPPNIKIKPNKPITKYEAKLIMKHKHKVKVKIYPPFAPFLTFSYLLLYISSSFLP